MKKISYISFLLALSVLFIGAGSTDFLTRLKTDLEKYNRNFPQEKIYVQTDKTLYKPTENIWYKAFLVNANDNKPSTTSDVFYIELIDPWGNIVEKHEHNANVNSGGKFILKEELPGGIYKLVAYTNWMKIFGEDVFFSKEITLQKVITPRLLLKLDFEKRAYGAGDEVVAKLKVTDLDDRKTEGSIAKSTVRIGGVAVQTLENRTKNGETSIRFLLPKDLNTIDGILQIIVTDKGVEESITRSIPIVLDNINISFYPEGGDLVENVSGKVAFEAQNEFGKGADVSGNIVDESGNIVTSFESFHLGMGAFEFTPKSGKKYYAKLTKPQASSNPIPLPEILKTGYVLNLKSQKEENLQWNIYSSEKSSASFVAQTQGEIYFSKQMTLEKGVNTINVSTKEFPVGIAVFTLFDSKNSPVCERLVFLNADKGLQIEIESKDVYAPDENAEVNIKTTDKNGNSISANLGVAVVDEQLLTFADDKQDNILSSLLFSSELKGKIQEPYFYFDETEEKAKEAIDYLMLTHGWRRFTWEKVQNSKGMETSILPEKVGSVYGYVLNKKGEPVQADVYLMEKSSYHKVKTVELKTTVEGHFVFHGIDISNEIFILTKLPNQVYLFEGKPIAKKTKSLTAGDETVEIYDDEVSEADRVEKVMEVLDEQKEVFSIAEDFRRNRDDALDEVVVVGYGTQRKSDLTGSIVSVSAKGMRETVTSSEQFLQGRVAGLTVIPGTSDPSRGQNIRLRGSSSLSGDNSPLIVINGVAVESSSDALSFLNPSDIQSMEVLKNASAAAIYGSRGANGVIIINTKSNRNSRQKTIYEKPEYGGVYLKKRVFYQESDSQKYHGNGDGTTVYWNANVKTDSEGKAKINFVNNWNSSTFRITVEGIAPAKGLIGSKTKRIVTRKPFSIDAKTPIFAAIGDVITLPVMAKNSSEDTIMSSIKISYYHQQKNNYARDEKDIVIPPNETRTAYFTLNAGVEKGEYIVDIFADGNNKVEKISRKITVREIQFPYQYSFSGKNFGENIVFDLPEYVPGSLLAEAVCYTSMFDELTDGVESIFREPYGCFEQVSSSTFPNIFALQLLNATGNVRSDISKRSLSYIENGYKKLAAYEVNGGGFEWYGGTPAHEVLSAYGLVEFYEMNKVYDKVDKKMMERTLQFILGRKDGTGGFFQNSGKYGFSGAPKNVNNAYIVYALTETENNKEIEKEYQTALNESFKSKDLYRMALMANSAYNMNDKENYQKLMDIFKEYSNKNKFSDIKIDATIVRTYGESAQRETIGFWMMALMKNKENIDFDLLQKCIEFINKGRRGGSFGNTQTTSVCLQALTKYAELTGSHKIEGKFFLGVNNAHEQRDMTKNKLTVDFANKLHKGKNSIEIKQSETENPYPYSLNISWQSILPPTSKLCPLRLSADLASKSVKANETVRLTVKLQNMQNEGQPMSVAIIGIPGGLSLQPWQLKELQEKEVFDFYEIINDNLVLYYRELGPSETKTVLLDLKAEVGGKYTGIASSAYLYYMNEHKYWIKGLSVEVK